MGVLRNFSQVLNGDFEFIRLIKLGLFGLGVYQLFELLLLSSFLSSPLYSLRFFLLLDRTDGELQSFDNIAVVLLKKLGRFGFGYLQLLHLFT